MEEVNAVKVQASTAPSWKHLNEKTQEKSIRVFATKRQLAGNASPVHNETAVWLHAAANEPFKRRTRIDGIPPKVCKGLNGNLEKFFERVKSVMTTDAPTVEVKESLMLHRMKPFEHLMKTDKITSKWTKDSILDGRRCEQP
jgi:hypothetical protein